MTVEIVRSRFRNPFRTSRSYLHSSTSLSIILRTGLRSALVSFIVAITMQMSSSKTLTFPHHVLYDYAVARLYLPADADSLVVKLQSEPDLLIAIRPSIVVHAQRLWQVNRIALWELAFAVLASPSIPEVGKLLVPRMLLRSTRGA